MRSLKMRPAFTIPLPVPADEAMDRVRVELQAESPLCGAVSTGRCAELLVDRSQRRLWSPHLSIQVEEAEEGSLLRGRFSPRPEVWTLMMFLYFTILSLAFFGAMLGCAQWMIAQTPWGLLAVPVGLALTVMLHVASLIGQHLGAQQIHDLQMRIEAVLQRAFGIDAKRNVP